MNSRKGGNKARVDFNRGQQQLKANEPQGGDLVNKSRTKISNFAKQEQKASMELLKSKDLNDFKNKVGLEVVEGFKKTGRVNPATRKTYTDNELEELVMKKAAQRLTYAFEALEKGGNPARQVIRQNPDIVKVYLKSGREIPPAQLRPDQLVEYRKGLTKGIGRGRERGD
jgi:hypothetical protein